MRNWTKADRPSTPKATQIVAFLSETILSESVRTGFYRIQADFDSALRDQKVAGSNPVTSTTKVGRFAIAYQLLLIYYAAFFGSFRYIHITKPDKTGHPLYTTSPDCNGLLTDSVWQGLVFFRATGKNQSFEVGSGQNQSEPDTEKQTYDRLVRPDFMYQTEGKMSLVLIFGIAFGLYSKHSRLLSSFSRAAFLSSPPP